MQMIIISKLLMRLKQASELYKSNGFKSLLNENIYWNMCAIAVEKNLKDIEPFSGKIPVNVTVLEVNSGLDIDYLREYSVKHKRLKYEFYLNSGYRAIVIKRGNDVLGDIWYATKTNSSVEPIHPDMGWLNLSAQSKDVYLFAMFLDPKERGNGMAAYLQYNALFLLKKKGFEKSYGYFTAGNIPALWVHRLLKWKEIKKVYTRRFIRRWVVGEEILSKSGTTAKKEKV